MEDNNPAKLASSYSDEFIRLAVLLVGFLALTYWFWPQYTLSWRPVHVQAKILGVAKNSFDYEFYDSIADKTLSFRREILSNESQRLSKQPSIEVVYAASNSDIVIIPSLQRPLPVWVFAAIHGLCLLALIRSIRDIMSIHKTSEGTN